MIVVHEVGGLLDQRYRTLVHVLNEFTLTVIPRKQELSLPSQIAQLDDALPNIMHAFEVQTCASDQPLQPLEMLYVRLNDYLRQRGLLHDLARWGDAILQRLDVLKTSLDLGVQNCVAVVADGLGDHDYALEAYEALLDGLSAVPNHPLESIVRSNMSVTLCIMGRVDEALKQCYLAIEKNKDRNNDRALAQMVMNLSTFLLQRGEAAKSLEMAEQALEIVRNIGDLNLEASFLSSLAVVLVHNRRFEDALLAYEEAIIHLEAVNNELGLARAKFNYSLLYNLFEMPEHALELSENSLAAFDHFQLPEAEHIRQVLAKWTERSRAT